jgi:hypothetical protein
VTRAYLEASEVETLEQAAANLRDLLLIRLLSHLGCRIPDLSAVVPNSHFTFKLERLYQLLKTWLVRGMASGNNPFRSV